MKTGNDPCNSESVVGYEHLLPAATAFQTINRNATGLSHYITGAAAGTNLLKVKVSFTVDDTTSQCGLTGSTVGYRVTDRHQREDVVANADCELATITFTRSRRRRALRRAGRSNNNYTESTSAAFPYRELGNSNDCGRRATWGRSSRNCKE